MEDSKRLILLLHSWNSEFLSYILRSQGYRVAVGDGYDKSLDMTVRLKPDLIITHLLFNFQEVMKQVDSGVDDLKGARELMKAVKDNPRTSHTKFLIYSISEDAKMKDGCPGADAYVHASGPEPVENLLKTIHKVLSRDS